MEQEKKQIKITLKRSLIGRPETQKTIAKSLGLSKINQTVTQADNQSIRGMVFKISHLVSVE